MPIYGGKCENRNGQYIEEHNKIRGNVSAQQNYLKGIGASKGSLDEQRDSDGW